MKNINGFGNLYEMGDFEFLAEILEKHGVSVDKRYDEDYEKENENEEEEYNRI